MTAQKAQVRPAALADADGIARVHVESWRETYTGLIPDRFFDDHALEARRAMWRTVLALDPVPGRVVVAERVGEVVGFAFAGSAQHPDASKGVEPARELHLFAIYVLASDHGVGTGHALLEAALDDRPAQLWVASENARARAFYETHRFRTDGHEITDPDVAGLVEVRMVR